MKLEVGMYVRTKDGEIHKIKSITNEYIEYENGFGVPYELREYIVKANENPIYVLEKNDYVNGYRVLGFNYDEFGNRDDIAVNTYEDVEQNHFTFFIEAEEIETIVTKEQFESMSYKIGE